MSSAPDQALAPASALDASGRSFVAFARWFSASVVMLSHLRAVMFVSWASVPGEQRTMFVYAIYFATAFFHEAVVVFFVLSGFLVAGPNINRARVGIFHPKSYGIDRFSRIYVTVVPALLFTVAADTVARTHFSWAGFFDGSNGFVHGRFPSAFQGDSAALVAGNLAMLQPIHVPVLGSNVPLWSLSYEVWFYVWFGAFAFALQHKRRAWVYPMLATAGLLLFHWSALFGLLIWCFGALAYQWDGWARSMTLALAAFALSLGLSLWGRVNLTDVPFKLTDVFVGLSFAWLLALMKRRSYRLWNGTEKLNQPLSDFSYSLYVIHFPAMLCFLAIFMQAAGLAGTIKQGNVPAGPALLVYLATAASTFGLAFLFSRLFEARTGAVRRWLKDVL